MPRKWRWDEVFSRREFWLEYFYLALDWDNREGRVKWSLDQDTEDVMEKLWKSVKGHEAVIKLPRRYALRVQFPDSGGHRLVLTHPGVRKDIVLGWCDSSPFADALRWEELQSIVSCADRHGRMSFDPIYVPLLLSMYVGVTREDRGRLRKNLVSSLRKARLFSSRQLQLVGQCFTPERLLGYDREWIADAERGWVARCEYSLRDVDSPFGDFDFAAFNRFMRVVEQYSADGR